MVVLPITLVTAAAAAILNVWLAARVGQKRSSEKVSIGDGGNEWVQRRMRAHANFAEYTPIVLVLMGLIELAGGATYWLWAASLVYLLARVAHGIGMDGVARARMVGTMLTMVITLALAGWAIAIAYTAPAIVTTAA